MFRSMFSRSLVTDVVSSQRSKAPRARRRQRRAVQSRLRDVSRVNAPESDMRPVLPARDALMAALAAPTPRRSIAAPRRSRQSAEKHAFLSDLSKRAITAAAVGDVKIVTTVFGDAVSAPQPVDRDVALRVAILSALHSASYHFPDNAADIEGDESTADATEMAAIAARNDVAERIMSGLAASGILANMRKTDVGIVLDVMVRGKLERGDPSGAFRIEQLSRVLEVGLRRGTYTKLMRMTGVDASNSSLALALGVFHRALVVGRTTNAAMFNTVLEACFRAGDGVRARAVLSEMSREAVAINGATLSVLLQHTQDIGNVDAVFRLLQSQVSEGCLKVKPGMALSFVKAYMSTSADNSSRTAGRDCVAYVERCFALIDWFYRSGIGVTAETLDALVTHLGERGNAEGAMHAWREMRRGWLGSPSRRGRRALVAAVCMSDVPSRLGIVVWPKLSVHMGERERKRLWRLQVCLDDRHDAEIMDMQRSQHDARDQAAVLHRWVRRGQVADAITWVSKCIQTKGCVDSRVLLALLGGANIGSEHVRPLKEADVVTGRASALKYVLEQLACGDTVHDNGEDRGILLQRVEDAVWQWMQAGGALPSDFGPHALVSASSAHSNTIDRESLREMLDRIVSFSAPPPSPQISTT
jgi:pentatricopeptide repeat protein